MNDKKSAEVFELTKLKWEATALEPVMSARTVQVHHGKHHAGYVATANKLLRGKAELASMQPLEVVRWAAAHAPESGLYRSAAQAWNHDFFWRSLSPGQMAPGVGLVAAIKQGFGDFERFAVAFADAGMQCFGSGWLWLTASGDGTLGIQTTGNADTPAVSGSHCLLTVDLWEHAYYLDYQNRRRDYLEAIIRRHLNWQFADANLAMAGRQATRP